MTKQSIVKFFEPTFVKIIIFVILFSVSFFVFTVYKCPAGWFCELPDVFYRGFPFAFYSWNEYAEAGQPSIFIGNRTGGEGKILYYAIVMNAATWYLFSSVAISAYYKFKK